MRSLSVELKLAFCVFAAALLASLAAARVAGGVFEDTLDGAALESLQGAADAFAAHERSEVEKLSATLDALLGNEALREAFVARDRERLLALAAPVFEALRDRERITHWYFIEPGAEPSVFLRVHKPELHGDRPARATLAKAVRTRALGAGKELGETAFALRVVRPWFHRGELVGYLELAEEIDHFLLAMKERTHDDYGLLVKKRFLDEAAWARVLGPRANTWNDRPDVVVVDTTTFTEGIIDFEGDLEAIPERGLAVGEITRGDRTFVRGIFPVQDAAGRKVGGLFVLHDFTGWRDAMRAAHLEAVVALVALGLALAAAVTALVRVLVFAPLRRLRRDLERRAAEAGLPPGRHVQLHGEDEIGRLERLFRRVLFPSQGRDDPPGDAPGSAAGSGH